MLETTITLLAGLISDAGQRGIEATDTQALLIAMGMDTRDAEDAILVLVSEGFCTREGTRITRS